MMKWERRRRKRKEMIKIKTMIVWMEVMGGGGRD